MKQEISLVALLLILVGCRVKPPTVPVTSGWIANEFDRDHARRIREMGVKKMLVDGPGLSIATKRGGEHPRKREIKDPHLIEMVLTALESSESRESKVAASKADDSSFHFGVERQNPESNITFNFASGDIERSKGKAVAEAYANLTTAIKQMRE